MLEQGSSQPQDDSELDALREQVKKLSSEKAALQEKIKKTLQGQKRLVCSIYDAVDYIVLPGVYKLFF